MIGYIGMYAGGLAPYLSCSADEMWVTGPVGRNHRPGVHVRAGHVGGGVMGRQPGTAATRVGCVNGGARDGDPVTRRMNRTEAVGATSQVPPLPRLPLMAPPTPVNLRRLRRSWRPSEDLAGELLALRRADRLAVSTAISEEAPAAVIRPRIGITRATSLNDSLP